VSRSREHGLSPHHNSASSQALQKNHTSCTVPAINLSCDKAQPAAHPRHLGSYEAAGGAGALT